GVGPGDYTAQIVVESMYASGSPRVIQVSMHVGCSPPNGTIDPADALQILRHVSGLPSCMAEAADVNCDGQINAVDALTVLRFVTGLQTNVPPGCKPLG
ncbi:MAG TPA: dockerin type I domain-containing protein, partial [Dehalococcoidia bacterium]|nr:dockerin type I domain-containing protein [Dehalococcoidia bacterium]